MNWLIDLGNTRLKFAGLSASGELLTVTALKHGSDDFETQLASTLAITKAGDTLWLAAVAVPEILERTQKIILTAGLKTVRVFTPAYFGGVRVAYAQPEKFGIDRFLGLLAAYAQAGQSTLVVSIGSAVTVDLLRADGQHLGGLISITPEHQRQSLAERFPALLCAEGSVSDFAATTADAVLSGSMVSALGLIERCLRTASKQLGHAPRILLTGGGAAVLSVHLDLAHQMQPDLVLRGLAYYATHPNELPA